VENIKLPISHMDDRGTIVDLIESETINAVTVITFSKGAVRANHYHKNTTQWNYLISGKIKYYGQEPNKEVVQIEMSKGDFIVTSPKEKHALKALENSELLVLTKGPRGGKEYETDTFRLENPLVK
jgi:quercetin dioxygenase-like cupin family protein